MAVTGVSDAVHHLGLATLAKEHLPGSQCWSPTTRQPSLKQLALLQLVHVQPQQPVHKGQLTAFIAVLKGRLTAFTGVPKGQACAFVGVLQGQACCACDCSVPTACVAAEVSLGSCWELQQKLEGILGVSQAR